MKPLVYNFVKNFDSEKGTLAVYWIKVWILLFEI